MEVSVLFHVPVAFTSGYLGIRAVQDGPGEEKKTLPSPDSNSGSFWPKLVAIPSALQRLPLINNAVILRMVGIIVPCEKWQALQIWTYIRKQFIIYLKYHICIISIIST
jgi:hypothetical protein